MAIYKRRRKPDKFCHKQNQKTLRIKQYFSQYHALGRLGVTNHIFGGNNFYKRKIGRFRYRRRHGRFSAIRGSLKFKFIILKLKFNILTLKFIIFKPKYNQKSKFNLQNFLPYNKTETNP